ncbi:hypothetical protein Tco_0796789 [Tanacetum coccineum]
MDKNVKIRSYICGFLWSNAQRLRGGLDGALVGGRSWIKGRAFMRGVGAVRGELDGDRFLFGFPGHWGRDGGAAGLGKDV